MGKIMEETSIIVIGNGSSILKYKIGEIIDSFEEVVRFNDYKIEGFKKYIGSKTTMWARSNSNKTKERKWKKYKQVLVCSPEWNYQNTKKIIKGKENGVLIPREDTLALQKLMGLPGRVSGKPGKTTRGWPSSGLICLDYLIKQYKVVYVHGFDYFKKIEGYPRHYYNNKEKMNTTYVHKRDIEKKWVKDRIEEGKLRKIIDYLDKLKKNK